LDVRVKFKNNEFRELYESNWLHLLTKHNPINRDMLITGRNVEVYIAEFYRTPVILNAAKENTS